MLGLGVVAVAITSCGVDQVADDRDWARGAEPVGRVISRVDAPLLPTLFPPPTPAPLPPATIAPMWDPSTPLSRGPFDIPLEFRLPSLGVDMSMLAVGRTGSTLMDAPEGPANDPVWRKAFLFRGGALPGAPGITTIIGHVDDTLARTDPFASIRQLKPGDMVGVFDRRINRSVHYRVTSTRVIWNSQANDPALLAQLFGAGAVSGRPEDSARDAASGVARLTLMTCTGQWRGSGFDRRYFVFGVRDESGATD